MTDGKPMTTGEVSPTLARQHRQAERAGNHLGRSYELAVRMHLKTRSIAGYKLGATFGQSTFKVFFADPWTRRASRARQLAQKVGQASLTALRSKPSAMV